MRRAGMFIGLTVAAVLAISGCGNKEAAAGASNAASGTAAKTITVNAKNFEFEPKQIKVAKGDTVTITLNNTQGIHAMKINGYNKEIQGGKSVTFVADKAGEFKLECAVFCGQGHADMTGSLIVQ
ncbi:hypothetical protein SD70_06095 [Gordoniibacillus kamchatkensis]|uniref:EfeO-type cupredoxin-like domain-containing protein n=1 Tax=Gordoniibacillus kamchatkensis TaxID=1590651 RepID=A0ABR5ALD0_9BACL|nr:cupredoxin domain-containing protein [Paenibacillus sp. VKM B-2647]KIL41678.1 hypothetical protein SD70_06095 [Paenibacillus sp. VKM B-2647]